MRGGVTVIALVAACGRIGFDPRSDGDVSSTGDGDVSSTSDGALARCAGVPMSCGANGASDCCESITVPGGAFYRSYDVGTDNAFTDMSNPATVSTFQLDRYEITVGRFRAFVDAGGGTSSMPPPAGAGAHPAVAASGWDPAWNTSLQATKAQLLSALACQTLPTWTNSPGANENRPINCISWYEAFAFCIWDGGFLPTEAEWNYAAVGGNEQRAWPWSVPASAVTVDGNHASYDPTGLGTNCVGDGMTGCAITDLVAVGSKPAGNGAWQHADMSGNVLEWTLDWYAGYPTPCTDCANLTPATYRVVRGGCFNLGPNILRPSYRVSVTMPNARGERVGARCARLP